MHGRVAEVAVVQRVDRGERGVVGVARTRQLAGQLGAGDGVEGDRAGSQRARGTPGDLDHGVGIARVRKLEIAGHEIVDAVALRQFDRMAVPVGQRCQRRVDVRLAQYRGGIHRRGGGRHQAAIEHQRVERQHQHEHQAQQRAGDGEHEVERQAQHADDVVRVLPEALEIASGAQREQVLRQSGQVDDETGYQRDAVQQADHAHQPDADAGNAEAEVQVVDQFRQVGAGVGGAAGRAVRRGELPDALVVQPVGSGFGQLVAGESHAHVVARPRVVGQHVVQQLLRIRQRGEACRWRRPLLQRRAEHGDGAGVERHEQGKARQQPHP